MPIVMGVVRPYIITIRLIRRDWWRCILWICSTSAIDWRQTATETIQRLSAVMLDIGSSGLDVMVVMMRIVRLVTMSMPAK